MGWWPILTREKRALLPEDYCGNSCKAMADGVLNLHHPGVGELLTDVTKNSEVRSYRPCDYSPTSSFPQGG
jgi:hypothetical protein